MQNTTGNPQYSHKIFEEVEIALRKIDTLSRECPVSSENLGSCADLNVEFIRISQEYFYPQILGIMRAHLRSALARFDEPNYARIAEIIGSDEFIAGKSYNRLLTMPLADLQSRTGLNLLAELVKKSSLPPVLGMPAPELMWGNFDRVYPVNIIIYPAPEKPERDTARLAPFRSYVTNMASLMTTYFAKLAILRAVASHQGVELDDNASDSKKNEQTILPSKEIIANYLCEPATIFSLTYLKDVRILLGEGVNQSKVSLLQGLRPILDFIGMDLDDVLQSFIKFTGEVVLAYMNQVPPRGLGGGPMVAIGDRVGGLMEDSETFLFLLIRHFNNAHPQVDYAEKLFTKISDGWQVSTGAAGVIPG